MKARLSWINLASEAIDMVGLFAIGSRVAGARALTSARSQSHELGSRQACPPGGNQRGSRVRKSRASTVKNQIWRDSVIGRRGASMDLQSADGSESRFAA